MDLASTPQRRRPHRLRQTPHRHAIAGGFTDPLQHKHTTQQHAPSNAVADRPLVPSLVNNASRLDQALSRRFAAYEPLLAASCLRHQPFAPLSLVHSAPRAAPPQRARSSRHLGRLGRGLQGGRTAAASRPRPSLAVLADERIATACLMRSHRGRHALRHAPGGLPGDDTPTFRSRVRR